MFNKDIIITTTTTATQNTNGILGSANTNGNDSNLGTGNVTAIHQQPNSSSINRLNMAECALIKSSQCCFQDKNRIKKDLTKLTKNLLLLVGLECVAQELVGGRRWRKLTAPFHSLEPDEIQDWSPSEKCYLCNCDQHHFDSYQDEIVKHAESCPFSTSPATDTSQPQLQPPTSCSCSSSNQNKIDSTQPPLPSSSLNSTLSTLQPNTSITSIPINVPLIIPVVQASPAASKLKSFTAISNVTLEQPLDLSLHSRSIPLIKSEISKSAKHHVSDTPSSSAPFSSSILRIPHLNQSNAKQGKKNRLETSSTSTSGSNSNWKRAYSEEELHQALNDIQSGKLGTRRAAVIYGIPRSTLRNKVYKLSSDRVNAKRGQGTANSIVQSSASSLSSLSTTTNTTTISISNIPLAASSSSVKTGSPFTTPKQLSNLPACAAVAAAAAAALAAGNTAADPSSLLHHHSSSTSSPTTSSFSGSVNNLLLSGRKPFPSNRTSAAGKRRDPSSRKPINPRNTLKPSKIETPERNSMESGLLSSLVITPRHTDDPYDQEEDEEDDFDDEDDKNNSISADLKRFLKQTIAQRAAKNSFHSQDFDPFRPTSPPLDDNNNPGEPVNDLIDMGSLLPNLFTDPLTTLHVLSSMDGGNAMGPLISQILLNAHAFPFANGVNNLLNNNLNIYNNMITNDDNYNIKPTDNLDLTNGITGTLPLLPELIRKLAQERLEAERSSGSNEMPEGANNESCDQNVILKVPSYQPKANLDVIGNKRDDDSITNEINLIKPDGPSSNHSHAGGIYTSSSSGVSNLSSHSLGDFNMNLVKDENNNCGSEEQRFKLFPVHSDESSSDALINENTKNCNNNSNSGSSFSRRKGEKRNNNDDNQNNSKTSDQSAPSTPDPKRNRPKRGRYRNYKRDDLAKAVKAVQNGEMSVHRAGTHFGVPHSTLEYKVKERHLLRPKKRQSTATSLIKKDDGQSLIIPKNSNTNLSDPLILTTVDGPLNPKSSSLVNRPPHQSPHLQPKLPQPTLESISLANQNNNASLWQSALPLFSLDFGAPQNSTNFFASNMMRRLKENAQLNETFNNNSNGGSTTTSSNTPSINPNHSSNISNLTDTTNSTVPTSNLKEKEFGSLLLETLIKSSLEQKMLNSMSSPSSVTNETESRLNRSTKTTSSTVPYRFHTDD